MRHHDSWRGAAVRVAVAVSFLGVLAPFKPAAAHAAGTSAALAVDTNGIDAPYVTAIYTDPPVPQPNSPVALIVAGYFPYPCGTAIGSPLARVRLHPGCADPDTTWQLRFELGALAAGQHVVHVALEVVDDPLQGGQTWTYTIPFEFSVVGTGELPYVHVIDIQPATPCGGLTICDGDSIRVMFSGVFPNPCYGIERIELQDLALAPHPMPPIVRLTVNPCAHGTVCPQVLQPWSAWATLPPLPARSYDLFVQLVENSCTDPPAIPPVYQTRRSFRVDSCTHVPGACLFARWTHPNGWGNCDAAVGPGRPASVTMLLGSSVALAGLQGEFAFTPSGLEVTGMRPVGSAAGMRLQWTSTESGARFVLFAEHGAPIPRTPGCVPETAPVLEVTLAAPDGVVIPRNTWVGFMGLLGSDAAGNGVSPCPIRDCPHCTAATRDEAQAAAAARFDRIANDVARICSERECDINTDGSLDVRDLVVMVRCVNHEGPCPVGGLDCDQNGSTTLEDVLCCAGRVLERPGCPECDPDSVRVEPGVRLELLDPKATAAGVDLSVRLTGAERVGAARLVLRIPTDRYAVDGVALAAGAADWLELHEVRGGELVVGLVRVGGGGGSAPVEMTLRLALRSGNRHGGTVSAVGGEFSGPDGVALDVDMGAPSLDLGGPVRIALGRSHPNPFEREVHFDVTLDRASDAEVAVFDLSGRRVASLFRGALPAGTRQFAWNGRSAEGAVLPSGVYFYRATAGGSMVAQRLVLLRRE